MMYYIFNTLGLMTTSVLPPSADAYRVGTYIYCEGDWYKKSLINPPAKSSRWCNVDINEVPKEYRAAILLMT